MRHDRDIDGECTVTCHERTRMPGRPAAALQGDDAVENGQSGLHDPVGLDEKPCEPLVIDPRPHMPLGLPVPRDAAETVLDPRRQKHPAVHLELGEIDPHVRLKGLLGHFDSAERFPMSTFTEDLNSLTLASKPSRASRTPSTLRIFSKERRGGAVLHSEAGPDDCGVDGETLFRRCRRQKIRFHRDPRFRPEGVHAEGRQHLENVRLELDVMVRRSSDNDTGHEWKDLKACFRDRVF